MSHANIITNELTIGYASHAVQRQLTLSLPEGELVCLIGKNGSGKSTLLNTLAGLLPPLSGGYSIAPQVGDLPLEQRLSLVLTERLSLENVRVKDIVALGRYPYTSFMGRLSEQDERIILECLEQVGLGGLRADGQAYADLFFNALSDGEKQRVLIAKALAQQTPVILLDEPTAHLDLPNRILVLRLLRRLAHEQKKTILLSTHELDLAMQLSDKILLMSEQGVQYDTAQSLKQIDAFSKAFGMKVELG